jgi:hypothetical protein
MGLYVNQGIKPVCRSHFCNAVQRQKSVTSGTLDMITPRCKKVQDVNTQFILNRCIATDNLSNEYHDLEFQ